MIVVLQDGEDVTQEEREEARKQAKQLDAELTHHLATAVDAEPPEVAAAERLAFFMLGTWVGYAQEVIECRHDQSMLGCAVSLVHTCMQSSLSPIGFGEGAMRWAAR